MSSDSKPAQQQFDWTKDSAECVEGIKFDLDNTYSFILDEFTKHDMRRKDGSTVTYKSGEKQGKPVLMYTALWKEEQTKVKFKLDYFVQDQYRVNENAPETEDDFVKLSRKLGYKPILGGRFSPNDFIHLGTKISAKLMVQPQSDADKAAGKKAYNTIDVDSIILEGEVGGDSQQEIPDEIPADVEKEIVALAKGCKKFSDLAGKINKMGAKDAAKFDLLEPAMKLNQVGKIKF